jgi:glycosyltransferase involved in cell wall biosynthesis
MKNRGREETVVFVSNSSSGGGAERATNNLVSALQLHHSSIHLININRSRRDSNSPDFLVKEINRDWDSGLIPTLMSFIKFNFYLMRVKPTVLVLNCDLPETFGALLLRKTKIIVVEHSSFSWGTRRSMGRLIRGILRLRRARWVSVGKHIQPWALGHSSFVAIPNLVTRNFGQGLSPNTQQNGPVRRLVYIGRLNNHLKQPDWIIRLASQINMQAVYIGDGPQANELKDLADHLQVSCSFLGYQIDPWNFLKSGDLLVVPSLAEGDPLVVVEAISRRIPILLRSSPGLTQFNLCPTNFALSLEEFVTKIRANLNICGAFSDYDPELALVNRSESEIVNAWLSILFKTPN